MSAEGTDLLLELPDFVPTDVRAMLAAVKDACGAASRSLCDP